MTIVGTHTNWGGNVAFRAGRVHRPASLEQLQELVASSRSVRALGTAHSFSRVADTTGDLVSVAGLPGSVTIDGATGTASVPAGMRFAELGELLHTAGWALPNLGSLPHISVAGACATGTHGSGNGNRCLASSVVGVEFVRGDGEVVTVDDTDDSFSGSVVGLGALGVVTRLRLRLVPTYAIEQRVWRDAPLVNITSSFADVMAAGYSVSLFSRATRPDVVDQLWIKSRAGETPADASVWGARPADTELHPIATMPSEATTAQLGVAGPWHERLPHFRADHVPSGGTEQQTEYLIPAEHGAEALDRVHRLGLGDVLMTLEIRTVAADDLWLSPCHDRATVGVHFTWRNDDAAVGPAVRLVEQTLADLDPRPHWGKVFALDPDVVRAHYPRRAAFAALAAHHDPERTFGNDYLETFVY